MIHGSHAQAPQCMYNHVVLIKSTPLGKVPECSSFRCIHNTWYEKIKCNYDQRSKIKSLHHMPRFKKPRLMGSAACRICYNITLKDGSKLIETALNVQQGTMMCKTNDISSTHTQHKNNAQRGASQKTRARTYTPLATECTCYNNRASFVSNRSHHRASALFGQNAGHPEI